MRRRAILTSLGEGILWPLVTNDGYLRMLFVNELPSLEAWPRWAKIEMTHRTRQIGEIHDE